MSLHVASHRETTQESRFSLSCISSFACQPCQQFLVLPSGDHEAPAAVLDFSVIMGEHDRPLNLGFPQSGFSLRNKAHPLWIQLVSFALLVLLQNDHLIYLRAFIVCPICNVLYLQYGDDRARSNPVLWIKDTLLIMMIYSIQWYISTLL